MGREEIELSILKALELYAMVELGAEKASAPPEVFDSIESLLDITDLWISNLQCK